MRFISLIVLIFLYSCSNDNIVEYKSYLNHHDTVKYVGMNECKACHYEIYNSYKNNDSSSTNKYFKLYTELDKYNNNFNTINDDNSLMNKVYVNAEFDAIIDNLENFYSSVVKANGNKSKLVQKLLCVLIFPDIVLFLCLNILMFS